MQLEKGIGMDKVECRRQGAEEEATEEQEPGQEHRVGLSRRVLFRAAQFHILSPERVGRTERECRT